MVCLYCSGPTRVSNSRAQHRTNSIWRRRVCLKCASIFTSTEHPDLPTSIMVLRPDNLLEPFNRDKLFLSIYKSCEHRPKAIEDATALTQIISTHLLASPTSGKLALNTITTTALTVLGRYDKTAATVYSAYYT
jgi:transcriptional repressor NrdR